MQFHELEKHFGTQAAIAKAGGTSPQVVWAWKKKNRIPIHWQYEFEDMTDGALKAERLRHRQGQDVT